MANFILHSTININNFIVKLYNIDNETIDDVLVTDSLNDVETLDYPNKIVEKLQDLYGVSKIEIFDTDEKLLVNSEKFIP